MIVPEQDTDKERVKPKKGSFFTEDDAAGYNQETQSSIEPEPVVQEQPQRKTGQQYVNELTSYAPEEPKYDPNRPEELKRLARHNAIAKGFGLISDIVSVGTGANVNRRQNDNMEAKYVNDMYRYMDDYTRRKDQWNWQNFAAKQRAAQLGISIDQNNRSFDANEAQRGIVNTRADKTLDYQIENTERDNTRQEARDKEYIRHNKAIEAQYGRSTQEKPIRIATRTGKIHDLSVEQASMVRDEAIRSREVLIRDYPHLFERTPILDERKNPTGEYEWGLAKSASEEDLIRAYIEYAEAKGPEQQKALDYINSLSPSQKLKPGQGVLRPGEKAEQPVKQKQDIGAFLKRANKAGWGIRIQKGGEFDGMIVGGGSVWNPNSEKDMKELESYIIEAESYIIESETQQPTKKEEEISTGGIY